MNRLYLLLLLFVLTCSTIRAGELVDSEPKDAQTNVPVTASINLRFDEALDPDSLHGLLLESGAGGKPIKIRCTTDLTNASITVVPVQFLDPSETYRLTSTRDLRTRNGKVVDTFALRFTTSRQGLQGGPESEFESRVFDSSRSFTTVSVGPDRRLYAASAFGELVVWELDEVGKPTVRKLLAQDNTRSRQYIDLEWDPMSSENELILWVSYAERLRPVQDPKRYFTGTVARLEIHGETVVRESKILMGLPHGREVQGGHETLPHQPNGLCFKDGKLYQTIGSTSSSGGPANWGIEEQPYSACMLEIDYKQIERAVDLSNGESHPNVRRFATGIRNALEIVHHSNGRMYTAVNINDRGRRADGVPDHPGISGNQNELIKQVTPNHESLFILERGRHYGFPNPSLGNYVLAGGNPTAGPDPFEITDYPVGTLPDSGFAPELMFPLWKWGGTSPDGMVEYLPDFNHPMKNALLCCFFSANDIAWMPLGDDGFPTSVQKLRSVGGQKLRFAGPLDLAQDPKTGSLYVADFGRQAKFGEDGSLIWLQPAN